MFDIIIGNNRFLKFLGWYLFVYYKCEIKDVCFIRINNMRGNLLYFIFVKLWLVFIKKEGLLKFI